MTLKISTLLVSFSLSLGIFVAGFAVAAPITDIEVTGNQRVENVTVEAYLPFTRGADFDAARIGDIVKTLYSTGLFADVNVRWENNILKIEVEENPLVNQVAIEGNENIDDEILQEGLLLKPRAVFTPAKAQQDARALEEAYKARGRFLTTVAPQLIERDQNRVDVVYKVTEAEETDIAEIRFVGNAHFDDGDLRDTIATKESAWWRFLTSADTYDPNRLEVDRQLIRRLYLTNGFADVQVQSAVAELARDESAFYVTFTVQEGVRYNFGQIDLAINAPDTPLKTDTLEPAVTLAQGELYNAQRIEENIDNLIDAIGAEGFAFLDVEPTFERNEAEQSVDVTFNINPGPRVYVNRIEIEGNTRTLDEVIRREMRLVEGDAFSSTKVRRSRERVNRLGFFEDVQVRQQETEVPDRVDLTFEVEEQSTGEFNIGAGFSTFEGLLASADVKERNLLGTGKELAVRFSISEIKQDFNIGFTEPYFLNRELAAGFDLFNEETDYQDESSFDVRNTGGAVRFNFPLSEFSSNNIRLTAKEVDISDIGSSASPLVAREAGVRNGVSVANTWTYDTRDSVLEPTRGVRTSLLTEYSGFGTDISYIKGLASASWHNQLADDWVLSLGGRVGAITDLGEDLPIFEHFSAGGGNLRGFATRGIGPRDKTTNDALGGKYLVGHNIELTFPLGTALDDLGVNGLLFTDGGLVTEFDNATNQVTDDTTYRISAGAGVHWRSPIGPLRLEFGIPLVKAAEDDTQIFSFNIGSRF